MRPQAISGLSSIIGAAMAVHNRLGHGYKEEVYERALAAELRAQGIPCETQYRVDVEYEGATVAVFFLDLFVHQTVDIPCPFVYSWGPFVDGRRRTPRAARAGLSPVPTGC